MKLGKLIGSGGFGSVYLAKYNNINVAVKVSDKFRPNELSIIKNIKGNHLVKVYNTDIKVDSDAKKSIIIMELCDTSISNFKGSLHDKFFICKQIFDALFELHSQDVAHMDIKPSNIMLKKGIVKLIDFGLATNLILNHKFRGTLKYVAPEVLNSSNSNLYDTFMADIWSLGLTLLKFVYNLDISDITNFDTKIYIKGDKNTQLSYYMNGNITDLYDILHISSNIEYKFLDILTSMLNINPSDRPTIYDLISSDFYQSLK